MNKIFLCGVFIFTVNYCKTQDIGEPCTLKDTIKQGYCIPSVQCDFALDKRHSEKTFQYCGKSIFYPKLCCPLEKSELKCLMYYKSFYNNPLVNFVVHGKVALAGEFPHMAIIGYGDKNTTEWLCGGSLISEQFVLTAAHCINSAQTGSARWVRLGNVNLQLTRRYHAPQQFQIVKSFVYPKYKYPSHYHDIALVKLDRPVEFNPFVKPACLHVHGSFPKTMTVTGWGTTAFYGIQSSHLLKAEVNLVDSEICKQQYAHTSRKKLARGIKKKIQLCAGHPEGRDACSGDSGGPLQFRKRGNRAYFLVAGVTSFGKACGLESSAGVYTRVAPYARWIERIVWPQ
ncbi:hypothetical protein MTP99_013658 [Tenebrio molitor]|nr:hypothetical protein MTP99_013658 [Tenebrio molitor]